MNGEYTGSHRADFSNCNSDEAVSADAQLLEQWAERLRLKVSDLQVFCRHGFHYEKVPPQDTQNRRDLLAYLKRTETAPPKWKLISGLYEDFGYSEVARRKRLRALYRAATLLIKRALARQRADVDRDERSIYWDPVAEVCRDLEIAQSKLSSLCKEFSGNSLSQVVDCVRAERVKKLMGVKVREFVRGWRAQCATLAGKNLPIGKVEAQEKKDELWEVWKALKESRRWPAFCQNTWAIGFGFSTYRRMYRACMAVWKETPHQMEMGLIAAALREGGDVVGVVEEEVGLGEIERLLGEVGSYCEEG